MSVVWWIVSAILLVLAVVIAALELLGLTLFWQWLTSSRSEYSDNE